MEHTTADTGPVVRAIRVLFLRWPSGLAVFLFVFALVAALVFLVRPVYRAEARLRLGEPPPAGGISPNASFFGFLRLGGDPFANDLELFDSRTLAEGVVTDAVLTATLDAPRGWTRDSVFVDLATSRETERAEFAVTWLGDGRVAVQRTAPADSTVQYAFPGEAMTFGGITATFRPQPATDVAGVGLTTRPFGDAVRMAGERIVVERTRRDANVVRVAFDDTDRSLAERVVASVVRRFVELRTAMQRRESGVTVDSLRGVAAQTLADLTRAEADLEAYQGRTRFVAPEEQSAAVVERYSETNTALAGARSQLDAVDRVLRRADTTAVPTDAWTKLVSHPPFLQNPTIGDMLARLIDLEQRRTELASRRTGANREVQVLENQIASLDAALRSLVRGYRDALAQEIGALEEQLAEMDSVLASVPSMGVELARQRRSVRLLGEMFVLTEQRLRQEELREALTFANVQIIDPPALQFKPVWPRKGLGLAVGFLLAGLFATLAIVVHERADRTVRYAGDIREAAGAPVLCATLRGRGRAWDIAAAEATAIVRGAVAGDSPSPRLALTGLAVDRVPDLARALTDTGVFVGAEFEGALNGACRLSVLPPLDGFRSAAQAASIDTPLVLVVECGRTTRDQLAGAARMLRESGSRVAGVIVTCARKRQLDALWP